MSDLVGNHIVGFLMTQHKCRTVTFSLCTLLFVYSPILDFLENLDAGELTGIIVGGLIGLIILCAIIEAFRQCCQDHECCRERNGCNRVAAEPGVGDIGPSAVDSAVYYIRSRAPVSASGLNQCSTELNMGENGEQGPPPYEYADTRAAVVPFRKYRNIDKGRDVASALQTRSKQ